VFHCDISTYICIVSWIGSSLLFFPFHLSSLLVVTSAA
jgi:hypothetical protein